MPSISILMPVYNAAPYLRECLDSIRSQSINDWELVAVDNLSTDNSLELLEEYARQEERIRVLANSENSIILALQKALAHSQGRWITRMDADDRMAPQKLERLREALRDKGTGYLATALVRYFADYPLGEGYRKYETWLNNLTLAARNFEDRYRECVIPSPCWMCSRADLMACDAFTPNRYPEDYDLAFRFFRQGLKIVGVPEILHYWRDYDSRSSRTHEHYSDNRFLDLKVDYFLALDRNQQKPLVIWGTGKKGKRLAQLFLEKGQSFHWLTNNEAKIGHVIYGQKVAHFSFLQQLPSRQIILSVAAPAGQQEIATYLEQENYQANRDYFWFC